MIRPKPRWATQSLVWGLEVMMGGNVTNTWTAAFNFSLFCLYCCSRLCLQYDQLATKQATSLLLKPLADHSEHLAAERGMWDCKRQSQGGRVWKRLSKIWLISDPKLDLGQNRGCFLQTLLWDRMNSSYDQTNKSAPLPGLLLSASSWNKLLLSWPGEACKDIFCTWKYPWQSPSSTKFLELRDAWQEPIASCSCPRHTWYVRFP